MQASYCRHVHNLVLICRSHQNRSRTRKPKAQQSPMLLRQDLSITLCSNLHLQALDVQHSYVSNGCVKSNVTVFLQVKPASLQQCPAKEARVRPKHSAKQDDGPNKQSVERKRHADAALDQLAARAAPSASGTYPVKVLCCLIRFYLAGYQGYHSTAAR